VSWLKPYLRIWYKAYPDSVPPTRQLAHYVKPLLQAHSEERIVRELAGYLEKTPPQFVNLHKFAATFGSWVVERRKSPRDTCVHHTDRPAVATLSRKPLCRECFEAS
jgi:hypothetical protein